MKTLLVTLLLGLLSFGARAVDLSDPSEIGQYFVKDGTGLTVIDLFNTNARCKGAAMDAESIHGPGDGSGRHDAPVHGCWQLANDNVVITWDSGSYVILPMAAFTGAQ